jgi:hypothetical protein
MLKSGFYIPNPTSSNITLKCEDYFLTVNPARVGRKLHVLAADCKINFLYKVDMVKKSYRITNQFMADSPVYSENFRDAYILSYRRWR